MASYNKVILLGNITRDLELRFSTTGLAVCSFGLAVNTNQRDKDDEHKYRYVKVDDDHLLHSLGYLYLACTVLINLEGHVAPITLDSASIT